VTVTDSRPRIADSDFEYAIAWRYENWPLTGSDLVERDEVVAVPDWCVHGSEGFHSLTPAQQTLLIWSDLVAQTMNGGIDQFIFNYPRAAELAPELLSALAWPELTTRLESMRLREQAKLVLAEEDHETDTVDSEEASGEEEFEDPFEELNRDFNTWFFSSEMHRESVGFVTKFLRDNRSQLVRPK
jgi:hypothetical protein